jgi:magnesium transporter
LILDTRGPVALSEVWIGARVIAHDVHGDDLADVLQQNGDASAWVVVPRSETDELRGLAKILGLDEYAVAELLAPDHRCRTVQVGQNQLVRMVAVDLKARELIADDVSMIITEQLVIILADGDYGRRIARLLDDAGPRLTRGGTGRVAQLVVDFVIDTTAATTQQLEEYSDEVADDLFGGEPLTRERKLDAFRLRRAVTKLRRVTEPTRELVQELSDNALDADEFESRQWNKIIDHTNRVANTVAVLGDSLTAIFDTSLSLDNARMDEVMKKLTGWAAIIAAPTLVTGFVGMNVKFWFEGSSLGFYIYLVVILGAVVVLYIVFRRKSWI